MIVSGLNLGCKKDWSQDWLQVFALKNWKHGVTFFLCQNGKMLKRASGMRVGVASKN